MYLVCYLNHNNINCCSNLFYKNHLFLWRKQIYKRLCKRRKLGETMSECLGRSWCSGLKSEKEIVMSTCKSILRKSFKYILYVLLYIFSLIVISIVSGLFIYVFLDKDCDYQFIKGCMSAGLSEEVCKSKMYGIWLCFWQQKNTKYAQIYFAPMVGNGIYFDSMLSARDIACFAKNWANMVMQMYSKSIFQTLT